MRDYGVNRREFLYAAALATAAVGQTSNSPSSTEIDGCRFQVRNGRFCFGVSRSSGPAVNGARLGLDVDGRTLWSTEASPVFWHGPDSGEISAGGTGRLELYFQKPDLVWTIQFHIENDPPSGTISSSIRNLSNAPVKLGRCRLADVSDAYAHIELGPRPQECVWLVMSGWQAPSRVKKVQTGSPAQSSKVVTQLYNPASGASIHAGFLTFDRINTEHEIWLDNEGQSLGGSIFCDFKGFALPGQSSIDSEQLLLQVNADPYDGLSKWADLVEAHYRPRIWPKTPAGWLGWAWIDPFSMERYEDVVHRNARAVRDRLPGFDIDYVWVSIGNLQDRLPGNWLNWNTELFPSGPQALIDYLRRLHFFLGLWTGAFWVAARLTGVVGQLHDAFLRQNGKLLFMPQPEWGDSYALDPTHPKTHEFLRHVYETYREWGVRYYMVDFLDAISGDTLGPGAGKARKALEYAPDAYFNPKLIPGPQAFRDGLRVIRESAGPDTYLLASTGPTLQNVGLVDAARVGSDHGEGRPLKATGAATTDVEGVYPGTFLINNPRSWNADIHATNALASHSFLHRKLFLVDSGNVMTIDKPVPMQAAQRSATLFGINGGPIMLGDDISGISEERLEIVKKVFPRLPECARAIDLFETPEPNYPKVFHLPVRTSWEVWDIVAVFNYENSSLHQNVDLERLRVDSAQPQVVWDFWNERYMGIYSQTISFDVPPLSVSLLRIAPKRDHPWLLSTDMHIRQGQAEIEDIHWDPDTLTITIRATRPNGYRGNLFLRVPKGFAFKDPTGLWLGKDANEGCVIVRGPLEFNNRAIFQRTFVRIRGAE